MSCDSEFHWTCAARTDIGLVRSRNEDAYLALPERGLWAVADGMGGHAFGDLASRAVVDALAGLAAPASMAGFINAARARLNEVNDALRGEARARSVPVMGSTVVVLLACGRETACLWAGDSRIYLVRGGRLQQLTRDHSQAEELRACGDCGKAADELIALALANGGRDNITAIVVRADDMSADTTMLNPAL